MTAPSRLYISLLVHEKPEVILDQLKNFRRFAPGAIIVMHVAKAMVLTEEIAASFTALGNVHINPERVATNATTLLQPHQLNIRYILGLNPNEHDKIAFHASNDMLVRPGVEEHLQAYDAGYYNDGILDLKNEPLIANAAYADQAFMRLCKEAGVETLIKTQIEGAYFQIRHLRPALALIDAAGFDWTIRRGYYAEEIVISTLVHAQLNGTAARIGRPYILSEVSLLMKYIDLRHRILGYNMAAKILGRILRVLGPKSITPNLVGAIRKGKLGIYRFYQKANGVVRFSEEDSFGVKRVEREIDNKLRAYIRRLA